MKNLMLFCSFIFCLYSSKINAQTQGAALNIGYSYINTNAGYIGGEYAYRIDPKSWQGISAGAGVYYGNFNRNFKFIPEAHFTYSQLLLFTEVSASPYHINPSIGFSFLNLFRMKAGYSWKLGHENVNMTGVTFGLNFLLGSQGFYDEFPAMM